MLNRKHIKVPKTYDPGGGRPKERLAYINKAEAELLRVLTDGVVERGPKGIPSFAFAFFLPKILSKLASKISA